MAAGRGQLPDGLLDDVKNHLDITWSDEATDKKISGLIAAGMAYLDGKLGEKTDYTQDGNPRTLLLEFVRYARDEALDIFENNYLSLLMTAKNARAVRLFAEKSDQTQ